ncbi:hypothetical protein EGW08_021274 [Elysia chlorotica]|uniref:Uncharacterized protein n=1 Tax=Elysia chlorotica TaxID=188477 RepID=A0A3S1BN73_ELYCH|nr:hypothetical protein EGW08_021274 [Elysia chlorotica]
MRRAYKPGPRKTKHGELVDLDIVRLGPRQRIWTLVDTSGQRESLSKHRTWSALSTRPPANRLDPHPSMPRHATPRQESGSPLPSHWEGVGLRTTDYRYRQPGIRDRTVEVTIMMFKSGIIPLVEQLHGRQEINDNLATSKKSRYQRPKKMLGVEADTSREDYQGQVCRGKLGDESTGLRVWLNKAAWSREGERQEPFRRAGDPQAQAIELRPEPA